MFNLKKRVEMLEEDNFQDLKNMAVISNKVIKLEKDIELIMDYLDVEKETINETFLTERQPEDYCDCGENEECPNCE